MDIEELIANGQRKLDEQAALSRKNQAEQDAEQERLRRVAINQFARDVAAATPDALKQYFVFGDNNDEWEPGYDTSAVIRAPGCSDITFNMTRFYEPDKGARESDYVWRPNKDIVYFVQVPSELYRDWELDQWIVQRETFKSGDIEIALAWACQAFQAEQEWAADAEKRNAKIAADLRAASDKQSTADEQANETKRIEDEERQFVCNILARDPVIFRLLQAFIAIQEQRAGWQEQLDHANDAMGEIEASYSRRLEIAEQRAKDAQRDAEEAHSRESDARDDAERAERKLKQAQRGW